MKSYSLLNGPINPFQAKPRPAAYRRVWRGLTVLLLAFGLFLAFLSPGLAGDGALDPSFHPGTGVSQLPIMRNRVNYDDGTNRYLIYGYFTSINGTPCSSLARFNADGTLDKAFQAPLGFVELRSATILANGQILIGGHFYIGDDIGSYSNLARLNSDLTLDSNFPRIFISEYSGFGSVNTIKVQSDGKFLVGGWSLQVSGDTTATYHLLRFNSDGSLDPSYPKRSAPRGLVNGISILSGDQARVYGILPNISGSHTGYLTTLDNTGAVVSYLGTKPLTAPSMIMPRKLTAR